MTITNFKESEKNGIVVEMSKKDTRDMIVQVSKGP